MGRMKLVKFKTYKFNFVSNCQIVNSSTRLLVNSFTNQLIMQFLVVLKAVQGILAGFLMALLLRIAFAAGTFMARYDHLCAEQRRAIF